MKFDHFSVKDLEKFALKVLKAGGYVKPGYAEATAFGLLEADKRGNFPHGLGGGTSLETSIKRIGVLSAVNPDADPEWEDTNFPTRAILNANSAPGHYTSMLAVERAIEIARKYGVGLVDVINANHFGMAGVWSEKIAEKKDLYSIVTCTTPPVARMMGDDPEGKDHTKGAGKKIRLGTNPIAISIPHTDGIITLDMATTAGCTSTGILKLLAGEMLPVEDYAADANYRPTRDPKEVIRMFKDSEGRIGMQIIGSLLPLGSIHFGYKGDGLSRFIEILSSLAGGPIGCKPVEEQTKTPYIKHTFQAYALNFAKCIDNPIEKAADVMQDMDKYRGETSRWPGDRAHAAITYCLEHGVPYSEKRISIMKNAADHVGVEFDLKPIGKQDYPKEIFRK